MKRNRIPPYRVFFTWDIHYDCNYRCSYCYFSDRWEELAKKNVYPGIDVWKIIWDKIYEKYGETHVHISGGEPFTYPNIIDLTAYLVEKHTIEFDTNLSFDEKEFVSKIKDVHRYRVKFAAAFHPEFVDFNTFLKKILFLKEAGCDVTVNYVAYPPQLKQMKKYKNDFNRNGISFNIMPFRGEYQGRKYPDEYTYEEKSIIIECDFQTGAKMLEKYTSNYKQSMSSHTNKGLLCRMGQMYAKIHPDGTAYRCCLIKDEGKLGNLINGTFELYEEPQICVYDKCHCWVAMIVNKEKDWLFHWVIPGEDGFKKIIKNE